MGRHENHEIWEFANQVGYIYKQYDGSHENHEIWEFANQVGYIYKQQDGSHENHTGSGMGCHCMARNR